MYALVDCNNFYASCERVFQPKFNWKPVAILSNNDGCVISRSNEAKAVGIPMGAPAFQIKELVKEKNVKFYADKQCLTVRHLSETVKNVIGKTASQIILEFQLKEAKAILLDTDKSIYQIATELGFSDSYTFGHFFKRHERISPSQFRKK